MRKVKIQTFFSQPTGPASSA